MIDSPRAWIRAPRRAIPKAVQAALRSRLEKHAQYALSLVATGSFEVSPEQAFDTSAGVYLRG